MKYIYRVNKDHKLKKTYKKKFNTTKHKSFHKTSSLYYSLKKRSIHTHDWRPKKNPFVSVISQQSKICQSHSLCAFSSDINFNMKDPNSFLSHEVGYIFYQKSKFSVFATQCQNSTLYYHLSLMSILGFKFSF